MKEDKYLLIPVKDLEEINPEDYHKSPTAFKAKIVSIAKQISLSESDIEKAAENYAEKPRGMIVSNSKIQGVTDRYLGYKQALIDILK